MRTQDSVSIVAPGDASAASSSPLSLQSLYRLFLAPRSYFTSPQRLGSQPELFLVALVLGVAGVMGQIDSRIIRAELGRGSQTSERFASWLLESWPHYWAVVISMSLISAGIAWVIWGWWYRKRLEWSGAVNPSPRAAREVYFYQELVSAAPAILVVIAQTLLFTNYLEAWHAEGLWSSAILLVFLFWSCWTSYAAATAAFVIKRPWALWWFLILPALFYALMVGAVGWLYAVVAGG